MLGPSHNTLTLSELASFSLTAMLSHSFLRITFASLEQSLENLVRTLYAKRARLVVWALIMTLCNVLFSGPRPSVSFRTASRLLPARPANSFVRLITAVEA